MSKKYSFQEIMEFYNKYEKATVLSTLKDGEWNHEFVGKNKGMPSHINGVRARMQPAKQVMSFKQYMMKIEGPDGPGESDTNRTE